MDTKSSDETTNTPFQFFTTRQEVVEQIREDLKVLGVVTSVNGTVVIDGYDWALGSVVATVEGHEIHVRREDDVLAYFTRNGRKINLEAERLAGDPKDSSQTIPRVLNRTFQTLYPPRLYRAARFWDRATDITWGVGLVTVIIAIMVCSLWALFAATLVPFMIMIGIVGLVITLAILVFVIRQKHLNRIPSKDKVLAENEEELLRLAMRWAKARGGVYSGGLRLVVDESLPTNLADAEISHVPPYENLSVNGISLRFDMKVLDGKGGSRIADVILDTNY